MQISYFQQRLVRANLCGILDRIKRPFVILFLSSDRRFLSCFKARSPLKSCIVFNQIIPFIQEIEQPPTTVRSEAEHITQLHDSSSQIKLGVYHACKRYA
jgi:hypothetical protein